jgi:hypothetical protein
MSDKILVPLNEVVEIAKKHTMRPEMFVNELKEKYKETPWKYKDQNDYCENACTLDAATGCGECVGVSEGFNAARELKDE